MILNRICLLQRALLRLGNAEFEVPIEPTRGGILSTLVLLMVLSSCGRQQQVPPPTTPTPSCPPSAPTGISPPTPERTPAGTQLAQTRWAEITKATYTIHYAEGFESDAHRYDAFFQNALEVLTREFAEYDVTAFMTQPVACHVYLHPEPMPYARVGQATLHTEHTPSSDICEIHFLTPTRYEPDGLCCTNVGEHRDDNHWQRSVVHEWAGVLLDRLNRQYAGWRFHDAPNWFIQGYEEYLGVTLSNEHSRTVTFSKMKARVGEHLHHLGYFGHVPNPYVDGPVLVGFLHRGPLPSPKSVIETATPTASRRRSAQGVCERP